MKKVQVLGSGCDKCKTLAQEIAKAAETLGVEIELTKVEDFHEIMKFGVMTTPALVIDGEVQFSGKVQKAKKLEQYLLD